jgi:hypothetical protein
MRAENEDRWITSYIGEERERCAELVKLVRDDPDFLLYCITTPVHPNEIEDQRKRFEELKPEDDIEDLM